MPDTTLSLARSYSFAVDMAPGLVTRGACRPLTTLLAGSSRCLVIIDAMVDALHGSSFRSGLNPTGLNAHFVRVTADETHKNESLLFEILNHIEEFRPRRRSEPVVVVAGGVLQDAVGLACGLYRRGIPYVRVPTTVIGQVDVSVASKVAVNAFGVRNRIGMYHPPIASLIDTSAVVTEPEEGRVSGMGEIIKMALIADGPLFSLLEDSPALRGDEFWRSNGAATIIKRAYKAMADQLTHNPWELDLRRSVDFGHTFSPGVEMRYTNELRHGVAVWLDVLLTSVISHLRGFLPGPHLDRVISLGLKSGLPLGHRGFRNLALLNNSLCEAVRHRDGQQHLPAPVAIGESVFFEDVTVSELRKAIVFLASVVARFPPPDTPCHTKGVPPVSNKPDHGRR